MYLYRKYDTACEERVELLLVTNLYNLKMYQEKIVLRYSLGRKEIKRICPLNFLLFFLQSRGLFATPVVYGRHLFNKNSNNRDRNMLIFYKIIVPF